MKHILIVPLVGALLVASLGAHNSPQASPEVYVPNYEDHTVSVLNAKTLEPVGLPIPITPSCPDPENPFGSPDAAAFTRDHRYVFVTIDGCDKIAVIDTRTRKVVKYIQSAPGGLETQIFLGPLGDRMYVTTCGYPTVAVIDVRTQKMVDVIKLPHGSGDMAFSPDGRIGYVGNWSDREIPHGCASPKGIFRLDLRTNTLVGGIPTTRNVAGLAVSPKGGAALATTEADLILTIDLKTNQEVGAVMCGTGPCVYGATHGVAFGADGTRAYVIDAGANELITIDTRCSLEPKELSRTPINGLGHAWELVISGNRLHVILYNVPSEVAVFDISGVKPVQSPALAILGVNASELDAWPDGGDFGDDDSGSEHDAWSRDGRGRGDDHRGSEHSAWSYDGRGRGDDDRARELDAPSCGGDDSGDDDSAGEHGGGWSRGGGGHDDKGSEHDKWSRGRGWGWPWAWRSRH